MIDNKARQLFKKGKLYEREWTFYTTVCYESPVIRVERIYKRWDKRIYNFITDLFFEFEYDGWKPIGVVELWAITGLDHSSITKITQKALKKMIDERKRQEQEINERLNNIHK